MQNQQIKDSQSKTILLNLNTINVTPA